MTSAPRICPAFRRDNFSSIEPLEARIAPSVFIVNSLADSGTGSLREALTLIASVMRGKFAQSGGGIVVTADTTRGSSVKIIHSVIQGHATNDSSGGGIGGGLDLFVSKSIVISGSKIRGNTANVGGGIYARIVGSDAGSGITISSTLVSGNKAVRTGSTYGGGLNVRDDTAAPTTKVKIIG